MRECYICGGKGTAEGCPDCGKKFTDVTKIFTTVATDKMIKYADIPKAYVNMSWSTQQLIDTHPGIIYEDKFKRYYTQLEKILSIFAEGKIPNQSAIIIADRAMGKRIFAYNCLKLAAKHGYSICPILDNTEVKYISLKSASDPNSKYLFNHISLERIIFSDVLFLSVDYDNYSSALRTIESIMDKRARFDKPTFIISRYNLANLAYHDNNNGYISLFEDSRKINNLKFPVIINGSTIQ